MSDRLFIVMPAFNEEENIEKTIKQWHSVVKKVSLDSRLVIINDGSTDNTFVIMQDLSNLYSQLIVVTKPNSGHGATLLYAYNYCINENSDYIFQTDSDGQTSPEEFWNFWEKRNEYDFLIGCRKKRQDGIDRKIISLVLKLLIYIVFWVNVKDPNTPFRLMKTEKLKPILKFIPPDFFLSNVLISIFVIKRKEKSLWLPVSFKPRQGGTNSMRLQKIVKVGAMAIKDFYLIRLNE
jgi:dolichol-phosphate mannosyltransferase